MGNGGLPGSPVRQVSVEVDGDHVVKRQFPTRSRLERERCEFGSRVAASSGLFEVPEVLSFDDDAGEIIFRLVRAAVPLKTYLAARPRPELLERAGHALASIHTACSDSEDVDVCWHGDYGMGNLLYGEIRDELTIVDWSNAHWALEPPERSRGPAGLDLGIAIFSLFHRMVIRGARIPNPERLGVAFLRGYARGRPTFQFATERPFLSIIHHRWRRYHLSRFGVVRTLAVTPSWARVFRFLSGANRGW